VSDLDRLAMSIVLVMPGRYEAIRRTVGHLLAQTEVDRLEIVIVAPAGAARGPLIEALEGSCRYRVVEHPADTLAELRAAGVRAATAPIVVFAEDHSYPAADWAGALIAAYRGPWGAVGPVVVNANPASLTSWADLLLGFGPWIAPGRTGTVAGLPWHNTSYLAAPLREFGPALGSLLEADSFLQEQLRKQGYELYQESRAQTHHVNCSLLRPYLRGHYHGRRVYAAARVRTQRWSVFRRLAYIAAAPLLPPLQLRRLSADLRRTVRPRRRLLGMLPVLGLGAVVGAVGEAMGYAFGPGDSPRRKSDVEHDRERFISTADRRELADRYPAHAVPGPALRP
jgi:hypothetical protein